MWKKGFFAWEYKKKKHDLGKALEQLTRYAAALDNPPLHVACDTHLFRIETRWTNEAAAKYAFELEELADPVNFQRLHDVFHNPDALRSGRTREVLTKEAADKFQAISDSLQHRNPDKEAVAHCSGNFLYLALQGVKDLEWRAILDCDALGLGMAVPKVGLDRRHPVAGAQRHPAPSAPDPAQARFDRMPRRAADAGRAGRVHRGGMAGGGFHCRQPAVFGRQADARFDGRRLRPCGAQPVRRETV